MQALAAAAPPPVAKVAALGNDTPAPAEPVTRQRSGWLIQVGALPDETEARQRLENARSKAKALLGKADPFTERTEKGDKVLYRARFAGLEKNQAEAACKHLKRSDIPCMLLKN
jgi:D-alanyl-D-alanine carboxypeptidase